MTRPTYELECPEIRHWPVRMETSSSVYKPLRVVDQQIRLLKLQRGKAADDLVGELEIVHLPDHPSFTALSYVWGDTTNQVPMTLNWRKHHITESLAIALRKVRAEDVDQRLWIDAICINQFDMREKSYQVQLMGDIYTQATDTCIWLGEEADDSNMAMDIIGSLNAGGVEENPITVDGLQAISKLQERPWWTRVWVIQGACFSIAPTNIKQLNSYEYVSFYCSLTFTLQRPCFPRNQQSDVATRLFH